MSDNPKSIPVPNDEYGFEDLCLRLYRKVLQLERLQNLGRRGQTQHGTDLIGNGIDGRTVCIQCKRREDKTLTAREIDRDINAILAKYPDVAHIRIATCQRRDSKLQHHVLVKEKALLPRCSLLIDSWQDIEQHLRDNADVLAWYVGPAPLPPELAQRLLAIEQGVLANSRLLISGQLIVASGASSIKPSLREALDEAQSGEPSRALGQREAAGRLLREYSLRPVPVPLMARALSVSDGLMYQGLVEPPSPGLWYSADTAAEIQNGVGLLSTSSPIVLDLSAAMTVFRGGWERLLTDSVLVVSRTYDCLREYADEVCRRRSLVLEHHGSLVPHEVPPDELALTKRKIDNFVSDLLYRTRATSSIDLAGLTVAERRELELCVGKSAAAAVATAMRREGILWTDDLALRAHAVRLFPALKVISTTAIVEHACQRSSIKHSDAVEILAQLHIWGYRGAPVTSEVMTTLLRRLAWNATSAPVVRCMDVVCEVDRLPKDVAHFLLHVLMCVWRARPLSPEPASVTAKLLGHLGKHPRRRECLDLLVRWSDAAFGLDVLAAVETQGVVQRLRKRNGW